MKALPEGLSAYRRTPEFDASSIPDGLRRDHATKAGVWGRIRVLEGALVYRVAGPAPEEHVLTPARPGVVEPEVEHEVEPLGEVRFFVEFLRTPEKR